MKTNESLTTPAFRAMINPWLTGEVNRDAAMLKRMFRTARLTLAQWRQVVEEAA
jgi:hypothetical protein